MNDLMTCGKCKFYDPIDKSVGRCHRRKEKLMFVQGMGWVPESYDFAKTDHHWDDECTRGK